MSLPSPSRILVTGANGFVGRHLVAALAVLRKDCEILAGTHSSKPLQQGPNVRCVQLDVTDNAQVRSVIADEQPSHVFHLAGVAAPLEAERDTRKTWDVNVFGTLNLALAVAETARQCRFVLCSSAEVYGESFKSAQPLTEEATLNPTNVYGASKAAADLMIGQMAKRGLRAIRLRPFNHTGPGQSDRFVAPAFASQIAAIERGEQEAIIRVGPLSSYRDFLDVHDVVDAYVRATVHFDSLPNGCALNIATGNPVQISEILNILLSLSPEKIEIAEDTSRATRNGIARVSGNAESIKRLLGWTPSIDIHSTLASVLNFWRQV